MYIANVVEDDTPQTYTTIAAAEVIGVMTLESYFACLSCKSKVTPITSRLGCCTKCQMMQSVDRCANQLNAKLIITPPGGELM